MKKILFAAIGIFLSHTLLAQIEPGSKIIGGGIQLNASSRNTAADQDIKSFGISVAPMVMKQIKPYMAAGHFAQFSTGITRGNGTNADFKQTNVGIRVGMFVQLQKWMGDKWMGFANIGPDIGYSLYKSYPTTTQDPQRIHQFSVGNSVTPGIGFRPSEGLLVTASVNEIFGIRYTYGLTRAPNQRDAKQHDFSFKHNVNQNLLNNINLSFYMVIPKDTKMWDKMREWRKMKKKDKTDSAE